MSKGEFEWAEDPEALDALRALLRTQLVAVLGTHNEGQPYTTLVGFAASRDLKSLFFATPRTTRKFANMERDNRVSMTLDNRNHAEADFYEAVGVTACGHAEEIEKAPEASGMKRFLEKHPHLRGFVLSPNCALMRIRVHKYVVVRRFQEVIELVVP